MPEIILPKTSFEVATSTIKEYADDPAGFLRRVAVSLQDENPLFLDASLRGAVFFAVAGYRDDAQQLLSGSFYRYECSAREIKKQGGKVPFIGEGAIRRTLSELAMLREGVHKAGGDAEATLRHRVMRIERDDPEIGNIVRNLLSMGAFIEGVHNTHLKFVFLAESEVEQTNPLPEPTQSSILPVVRRSIVRSALLETILDPEEFATQVFDHAGIYIPGIVSQVRRTAYGSGDYSDIYELLASFTINGIMQEFSQRGEAFPTIKEEDHPTHPDPAINKAMEEDPEEASRLIREYNLFILDEIKNTNPHIYWGIDVLLNPLSEMTGPEMIIAIDGIVNPYSSLRVGMS